MSPIHSRDRGYHDACCPFSSLQRFQTIRERSESRAWYRKATQTVLAANITWLAAGDCGPTDQCARLLVRAIPRESTFDRTPRPVAVRVDSVVRLTSFAIAPPIPPSMNISLYIWVDVLCALFKTWRLGRCRSLASGWPEGSVVATSRAGDTARAPTRGERRGGRRRGKVRRDVARELPVKDFFLSRRTRRLLMRILMSKPSARDLARA